MSASSRQRQAGQHAAVNASTPAWVHTQLENRHNDLAHLIAILKFPVAEQRPTAVRLRALQLKDGWYCQMGIFICRPCYVNPDRKLFPVRKLTLFVDTQTPPACPDCDFINAVARKLTPDWQTALLKYLRREE